ncbi:hypothetical protein [Oceanirhabdus sp. W0125-5]|uniref:hypothetical protein n=1 Tax=Oceanirhabdus sp. W0125-5 TaxID=2999116 RepID=UPI0022F33425|nr:hypothetical protein [Oceanirhabdus sp. W0125-5]WBW99156.1 hypothetical protein OW730_10535 [Oceanirhabdus sp. W0125-5]
MKHVFKAKKDKIIEIMVINCLLLIPGLYLKQPLLFLIPVGLLALEYMSSRNYIKLIMNAQIDMDGDRIDCNLVYDKINMKWEDIKYVKLGRESGELLLILQSENVTKAIPMDIFKENEVMDELGKHIPNNILEQTAIV